MVKSLVLLTSTTIRKELLMADVTKQIYDIVNSVVNQSMGLSDITVVDEAGLIALGDTIINSSSTRNAFVEGLIDRIGKTIVSYRQYRNKFASLVKDDFEWGAVLQKIKVEMPEAEIDESHSLTDGESIDQYVVAKPVATQKLFYTKTPYQFHITIQTTDLKEAFTSSQAMGTFYSAVYGEVQNKIELSLEDLGRNCVNNFIGEIGGGTREIKLLTEYKAIETSASDMTAAAALRDEGFLKYASQRIQEITSLFTEMTKGTFNDNTATRHTPKDMQKMFVLKKFSQALETHVLANAFNKEYDELGTYEEVNFWQALKKPFQVKVKKASNNASATTVDNVIGVLFDREAMGIYKTDESADNSPYNAAGRYYNVYWHETDMYFNDLSENGVVLTLN